MTADKNIVRVLVVAAACVVLCSGCLENREEITKEILAEDPFFSKWINKRTSLEDDIKRVDVAYENKISELKVQMESIKEKMSSAKAEHVEEVENIKKELDPEKQDLRDDLIDMRARFKLRKVELIDVVGDLKEVRALMDKKDRLEFTREEVQVWNRKLSNLSKRKEELEGEIDKLKKDMGMTRKKVKVLEF